MRFAGILNKTEKRKVNQKQRREANLKRNKPKMIKFTQKRAQIAFYSVLKQQNCHKI